MRWVNAGTTRKRRAVASGGGCILSEKGRQRTEAAEEHAPACKSHLRRARCTLHAFQEGNAEADRRPTRTPTATSE